MNYVTTDKELTVIADALRRRNETQFSLVYPSEYLTMVDAISNSYNSRHVEDLYITKKIGGFINTSGNLYAFSQLKSYAFACCSNLTGISTTYSRAICDYAFYRCTGISYADFSSCTSTIGMCAFAYCENLSSIRFERCTTVGTQAFYGCIALPEASLPSCSIIGADAFRGCINLECVSCPSVSVLYSGCFKDCVKLSEAAFPSCRSVYESAFQNCTALTGVSLPSCSYMGSAGVFAGCSNLVSVSLPALSSFTSFNPYILDESKSGIFDGCTALTSVYLPGVSTIPPGMFRGCANLPDVSLSDCTFVGASAFHGCARLSQMHMPVCTSIYTCAFQGCSMLSDISFPLVEFIAQSAFIGCTALPSHLSFSMLRTVGAYAFQSLPQLERFVALSADQLGSAAFQGCSNMTRVYFSAASGGPIIDYSVFQSCYRLVSVYIRGSAVCFGEAFQSTPIGLYSDVAGRYGSIYVPTSLYSVYRNNAGWATYYDRLVSMTDAEFDNVLAGWDSL